MKEQLFYGIEAEAEDCYMRIRDVLYAFSTLDDVFDREGFREKGEIEDWEARCFMERFPLFLSTYRVICRELWHIADDLGAAVDSEIDQSKK